MPTTTETTTLDLSWHLGDRADLITLAAAPDAEEAFWEGSLWVEARVSWEVANRYSPGGVTRVDITAVELDGVTVDPAWLSVLGIVGAVENALVGE